MKKIILFLFALAIVSANIIAQEAPGKKPQKTPEERAENITRRMTKELALNPDQQKKVKELILQREQEKGSMTKGEKAGKRAQMDNDLKVILTPEQYQLYQQKREEMSQRRKEKKMAASDSKGGTSTPPVQNQK